MTIRFVTFTDDGIAINPDAVVYVQAGLGIDAEKSWIHFTGNNQPVKVAVAFRNVLNALEYTEDEGAP